MNATWLCQLSRLYYIQWRDKLNFKRKGKCLDLFKAMFHKYPIKIFHKNTDYEFRQNSSRVQGRSFIFCKRENFGESCNLQWKKNNSWIVHKIPIHTPYFFLFFCKIAKVFACIMVFASRIAVLPAADGTQVTK